MMYNTVKYVPRLKPLGRKLLVKMKKNIGQYSLQLIRIYPNVVPHILCSTILTCSWQVSGSLILLAGQLIAAGCQS
jgi:hypothetical protein